MSLDRETEALIRSWMQHDRAMLRDYLVRDVQDPRLNVQSILARHFLIERLFPGRFGQLMEQELRFGAAMNWLLCLSKSPDAAARAPLVFDALLADAEDPADSLLPRYLVETCAALPADADGLPVPDYIGDLLAWLAARADEATLPEPVLQTFQHLWSHALAAETVPEPRPAVLEIACGSANDYRFFDAFGLARFIEYTGVDLCEKNVVNARSMFPGVRFDVGNALRLDAPDAAYDYVIASDLYEHLSVEAMEAAVAETCRVTRREACILFFSMQEAAEHVVRPIDEYHINVVAMDAVRQLFLRGAKAVEAISVDELLRRRLGCDDTPNKRAWVFTVTK